MKAFNQTIIAFLSMFILQFLNFNVGNAQELSMFQGPFSQQYYEDDRQISKQEFVSRINSVPESAADWKKYKTNSAITIVSSLGTGVALYWWISRDDGESTTAPVITTLGGFIITSLFQARALKHQKEAVLGYNRNETSGYHVTPSNNGIGLTVHF